MKKGYEKPGHLWTKRIPKPGGGYYYVYDTKKVGSAVKTGLNNVVNNGKKLVKRGYNDYIRMPGIHATSPVRMHPFVRGAEFFKSKKKSLAGRLAERVNTDPMPNAAWVYKATPAGRRIANKLEKGIDRAGYAVENTGRRAVNAGRRFINKRKNKYDYNGDGSVNFRDAGDYIGDSARKIGKKIKKYAGRFESATNNRPDLGDIPRNFKKMSKRIKKFKKDHYLGDPIGDPIKKGYKRLESRFNGKLDAGDVSRWGRQKKAEFDNWNNRRKFKKKVNRLRKNVKKKINAIF